VCPACLQVWVYGVVLPSLQKDHKSSLGSGSASGSGEGGDTGGSRRDMVDAIAGGIQRGGMQPGMVRPPALVAGEAFGFVFILSFFMLRALCSSGVLVVAQAAARPCCLLPLPRLPAEFMAGGSLRSALARKADIVAGALTRVVLALDAAKVGWGCG
jgi:hypothetical protein